MVPKGEELLRAAPDGQVAVLVPEGSRRLGLDVALVDRLGPELPLHNDVRFREGLLHVALAEHDPVGQVAAVSIVPGGVPADAERRPRLGEQPLMEDRGIVLQGVLRGEDPWKHLVVHLYEG